MFISHERSEAQPKSGGEAKGNSKALKSGTQPQLQSAGKSSQVKKSGSQAPGGSQALSGVETEPPVDDDEEQMREYVELHGGSREEGALSLEDVYILVHVEEDPPSEPQLDAAGEPVKPVEEDSTPASSKSKKRKRASERSAKGSTDKVKVKKEEQVILGVKSLFSYKKQKK